MISRKTNVARSFSRAACSYDSSIRFQKPCVKDLDRFIAGLSPEPETILEAGCGTGNMTDLLHRRFPHASISACDLAEEMTESCRNRFRQIPLISCFRHDFDSPFPVRDRDLAVSSLSLQWSDDLFAALRNLADSLKPGGTIVFSIPLTESLSELHDVFRENGAEFPGLSLPAESEVRNHAESFFTDLRFEIHPYSETYDSLRDLLHAMRGNGTSGGRNGTPIPVLKKILAENRGTSFSVHYRILFVSGRRRS